MRRATDAVGLVETVEVVVIVDLVVPRPIVESVTVTVNVEAVIAEAAVAKLQCCTVGSMSPGTAGWKTQISRTNFASNGC